METFRYSVASRLCAVTMTTCRTAETAFQTPSEPRFHDRRPMPPPHTGRHALIIEDEILIAMEVESLLHDFGFESCDIVDNPADALKSALAHRPDLVTADMRILGGTGVEAMIAI